MSFFAEVLVEAIGWPVVIIGLALVLFLPPKRHSRRPVTVADLAPPPPSVTTPEPKAPRDLSRPYPRPGRTRSKLTRVCPVCGMEDPGSLDGKVLGWPAHRSCAEWLGEWGPERRFPVASAGGIAAAKTAISVNASPGVQINVGDGNRQVVRSESGTTDPIVVMTQQGAISLNEARERLNREIVASWGVPPAMLQEHTHKVGDPVPSERCPKCGARFAGPPDYLREAFKVHRQVGCR